MADGQKMVPHFTEQAAREEEFITFATYQETRQKSGQNT
jgi:hypothetical protein